jgi:hypothetical protein
LTDALLLFDVWLVNSQAIEVQHPAKHCCDACEPQAKPQLLHAHMSTEENVLLWYLDVQ